MLHYRKDVICRAYGLPQDIPNELLISCLSGSDPLTQTELRLEAYGQSFAKGLPNVLIMSGDKDVNVIYEENAVAMHRLLTAHGVDSTLHPFPNVAHVLQDIMEPIPTLTVELLERAFEG